ncbi:MAG: hypothetical protein KA925_11110, partial [Pseudoxanthomonas sp.]|nr:hypothetical protein [Pseudoxanthomonas sp.]
MELSHSISSIARGLLPAHAESLPRGLEMFLRWMLMLLAVAGLAACSADRAPDAADAAVADPASAAAQADAAREPDEYEDDDVLLSQHPVPHVVVKEAFIT